MRACLLSWFLCCLAVTLPAVVLAQPATTPQQQPVDPAARSAFEEGLSAYDRGQFEVALAAFERAYKLSPRPKLLFNIGRAADGDAQYARAIGAYQAYLAELPAADNREFVESRISKLSSLQRDTTPAPTPLAPVTVLPAEAASQPGPRVVESAGVNPHASRLDTGDASATPLWTRGWVWGVAGGVVAVGVAAAIIAATRGDGSGPRPTVDEQYMTLGSRQ